MKKILAFFDKFSSDPKNINLLGWGIEGKHYKMEKGKPVYMDQKLWDADINSNFNQLGVGLTPPKLEGNELPIVQKKFDIINSTFAA